MCISDRINMAQLTAGATQDVALSGLDLARRHLIRADRSVDSVVDGVMRREPRSMPGTPEALPEDELPLASPEAPDMDSDARRTSVSGHYAGPVSRILAIVGDLTGALTTFGFFGAATLYLLSTFTPLELTIDSGGWVSRSLLIAWILVWFGVPVALFGRTLAMAIIGIAVVRRDGGVANGRRALVRALVLPLSVVALGLGLLGIVFDRERRTWHDLAAGTVVIYDWGAREAEAPATLRDQLSARVRRRRHPADGVDA